MTGRSSFGGHGMDRYLIDYEAVADPVEAAAEAPAPEPEAPAEEAAAAGVPEAPAWQSDPAFRDFINDQIAEGIQARTAQFEQPATEQPQEEEGFDLDPFSDDFTGNFDRYMTQREERFLAKIDQRLEPVTQRDEREARERQDQQIDSMVTDAVASAGFPAEIQDEARDLVRELIPLYGDEMLNKYGPTERAAQAVMNKAIGKVNALLAAATKAGATAEQASLTALTTAARELPGAGGAVVQPIRGGDEMDVVARYTGTRF